MTFKKNIYVAFTEHQFLQAVNIATEIYNSAKYINDIYLVRKGRRLMAIDANQKFEMDNIKLIIFDKLAPKVVVDHILNEKPDHFIFFQAISPVNVHLAYTLKKRGVEISLGPDGYGTYAVFNKRYNFLSLLKNSLKDNYFLYKNKLFTGKIHKFDYYKHGNNSFIDNLWISHPEQYIHQSKNSVKILKLPILNSKCVDFIKKCYQFSGSYATEKAIYYFCHPLYPELVEEEMKFLRGVLNRFNENKLIIKLHPLTNEETISRYESLPNVQIIRSKIPAEVLLLSLRNCVVFTGWSTTLITENATCNYYFNYPIYEALKHPILSQIIIMPLHHIEMINSPEEMKFPNE